MSFRQYFPTLFIAVVAGAILAGFLLVGGNPERDIRDAALDHVRRALAKDGLADGADFQFGQVEILSRTDSAAVAAVEVKPNRATRFLHLTRKGGWHVQEDLNESFNAFCQRPELATQVLDRLAVRLRDRWQMGVSIREGMQCASRVGQREKVIVGTFDVPFTIKRNDGKFDHGRYVESFRFENGTWVLEGAGALYEKVPG